MILDSTLCFAMSTSIIFSLLHLGLLGWMTINYELSYRIKEACSNMLHDKAVNCRIKAYQVVGSYSTNIGNKRLQMFKCQGLAGAWRHYLEFRFHCWSTEGFSQVSIRRKKMKPSNLLKLIQILVEKLL